MGVYSNVLRGCHLGWPAGGTLLLGLVGTSRVAARVWPSLGQGSHVDQARDGPRPPATPSLSPRKTFLIPSRLFRNWF
jgi:hypothetical protein